MQNIQIIEKYLVNKEKSFVTGKFMELNSIILIHIRKKDKMCFIFYSICGIKIHKNTTDKFKMSEKAYREILKDYY